MAPLPQSRKHLLLASIQRIGRVLALAVAMVVSLLTFPAGIVWMTACWLTAFTISAARGRRASWLLGIWMAVVVIKRVDWPRGLWVLILLTGAVIGVAACGVSKSRRFFTLTSTLLWLAWLGFALDYCRAIHINHNMATPDGRPIVCIGDSLTSYTKKGGYPEVLAEMISLPVINLGQPGITSAEAFKKLPEMKSAGPCVVVIELGGHDFLKDTSLLKSASRKAVERNLEQLITAARELNAEVVLLEVPRGFVIDPYAGLERRLARKYDLELISDTTFRRFVLSSPVAPPGMWLGGPYLSDDGLHPNARGNAVLADRVLATLKRIIF